LHKIWHKYTTQPGEYAQLTKKEPEVKSHDDVISRMSGTNVGRSQRLPDIFEPNFLHSSRNAQSSRRNMPNSLIMKIQYGGDRHIKFRKKCKCFRSTGNDCKKVFSLRVVESVSDDNNFYICICYTFYFHFCNFLRLTV